MQTDSRSISRSSISTRARRGCSSSPRPSCCGAGSAAAEICWDRRRSIERLRDIIGNGCGGQFEIDSDDRCLKLGATAFGDMLSLTVSDVTAIKRREVSFRLLFDNNPMPMWVFDAETTNFLSVNDAAVQHYGYRRETFLGMKLQQIWPEDEWASHSEALREIGDVYHSAPRLAAYQGRRQRGPCADLRTAGRVRRPRRLSGGRGRYHRAPQGRGADRPHGPS